MNYKIPKGWRQMRIGEKYNGNYYFKDKNLLDLKFPINLSTFIRGRNTIERLSRVTQLNWLIIIKK